MRSTPEQDARLRLRLAEAVAQFAGGSADKFGQLIGYANGGYIREVLNEKKPVREKLIERVHARKEMTGWFTDSLTQISITDVAPAIHAGPAPQWPFRRMSEEQWRALDDYDRVLVEDAAVSRLRQLLSERATPPPASVTREPGGRGGLTRSRVQHERRQIDIDVETERRGIPPTKNPKAA